LLELRFVHHLICGAHGRNTSRPAGDHGNAHHLDNLGPARTVLNRHFDVIFQASVAFYGD
jgi:hypothetical protein